jgi:hypothetical protein
MMKIFVLSLLIGATALIQGCRYPDAAVIEQSDSRPAIGISGAPEGAHLYVDGLDMGAAELYDREVGILLIESGKHIVELKDTDGGILLSEEVFLSSSTTKIITYHP